MKINKRGQSDLVPTEVIRIILSIIIIVMLIALVTALFNMFSKNQQLMQANATIYDLNARFDSLKIYNTTDYLIQSPRKWYLISYPLRSRYCICKDVASCDNKNEGVCVSGRILNIGSVCGSQKNCIFIEPVPLSFELKKINNEYSLVLK